MRHALVVTYGVATLAETSCRAILTYTGRLLLAGVALVGLSAPAQAAEPCSGPALVVLCPSLELVPIGPITVPVERICLLPGSCPA